MTETNNETKTEYTGPDSHPGQFWVDGKLVAGAEDEDAARAILASVGASEDPPAAPHKVKTYAIVTRLQAAGLAETAMTVLQADPVAYARFFTADSRGGVDSDAADVRAFLTSIGADPDVILAPDEV